MIVAELFAKLGLQPDRKSWEQGHDLISGMHKALGAFIAGEAIKKLGETVMATIDLGGHLDDLRQKTGLSAEALQSYGYAAKLGGSDMDSFAGGVTKFAKTLREAQSGSKDAEAALHQAGLTSAAVKAALTGGSDGLDGALMEIADRFAAMKDGPKKTALAMQLFGKSGAELIPTLNRGGDGLRELRKEAQDLGVVMGEDTVSAADDLGDNIDKVKMSITGLKNQAVAALLPTLKLMVDGLMAWIKANKQLVIETLTGLVKGFVIALQALGKVFAVIAQGIAWLSQHAEVAKVLLMAIGIVVGLIAAEAVAAMVVAAAAFALPVAAIAALIFWIKDIWNGIANGKGVTIEVLKWIRDKFFAFGRALKDVLRDLWNGIKTGFRAAFDFVADLPVIHQLIWLIKKVAGLPSSASGAAHGLIDGIKDLVVPSRVVDRVRKESAEGNRPNGATGTTVNNTYGDVNVTSPNADPKQVGDEVNKHIENHWNNQMVDGMAAHDGG